MEGLISKYNRGRKISKGVVEYRRTGKTKKERELGKKPIGDDKEGFIYLYVISKDTNFIPRVPLAGSVVEIFSDDQNSITYKLLDSNPLALCFLDIEEGKKYLGDGYSVEVLRTQLASAGVTDSDLELVFDCVSDNSVPSYFNIVELTSIIPSAGFDGFVYTSPLDKKAFTLWGGVSNLSVISYSTDMGKTWIEI
jgi:hypothetical protein